MRLAPGQPGRRQGSFRRPRWIAAATGLLAGSALAASLLGPGTSTALEGNNGCPNPDPIYRAHDSAKAPQVFYIGDSISANGDQKAINAQKNWDHRWRTLVIAQNNAKIDTHRCLNWLSFYYAAKGNAKAVVVELGTNDINGIFDENYTFRAWTGVMDPNTRLREIYKVFTEMNWVANYLKNKCVVWVGMNEFQDSLADDRDVARAFNTHIKDLAKNHSNLHYGNYSSLVQTNSGYYNSLYKDDPMYGHHDTIHPLYPGRWILGSWITGQVDRFCI
jgi:lysophospholipase L1-like esterase